MQDQLSVPSNFSVNGNNVLYLVFDYKQLNTNNEICWFCRNHKRSDRGKKSNQKQTIRQVSGRLNYITGPTG